MKTPIIIEVEVKTIYGKPLYYPKNHNAEMLAQIAGTNTLTPQTLKLATDMGMEVKASITFPQEVDQYAVR
jgi:hypothetical protein